MSLDDAQDLALKGNRFGDIWPMLLHDTDRELFKAWWLADPSVPVIRLPPQEKLPPPTSGNVCKTCGGLMVRSGKCEYCPQGCGSEGECS